MIYSPLRYPGGKGKLYPFFVELIRQNGLFGSEYCEPYAGGAGLAIKLLANGFVKKISINDLDQAIYSFWMAALKETDKFCRMIDQIPVTIDEWHTQKEILKKGFNGSHLNLGFAAFFLNRTNRSGIIEGAGPIGGFNQSGASKIDARLVKEKQIENLFSLSKYVDQIEVSNLDASKFLSAKLKRKKNLIYLDPPYYVKGYKLYRNFYRHEDHIKIADQLGKNPKANWIVSYDNVPEICDAYKNFVSAAYFLNYSAGRKTIGSEIVFVSDAMDLPNSNLATQTVKRPQQSVL